MIINVLYRYLLAVAEVQREALGVGLGVGIGAGLGVGLGVGKASVTY